MRKKLELVKNNCCNIVASLIFKNSEYVNAIIFLLIVPLLIAKLTPNEIINLTENQYNTLIFIKTREVW
ncbi:MAG TPA: hypothetical protein VJ602_01715, partial [Paludibacter sp.]|nr:hypothetical protein [Paludibacter sp.]